MREKALKLDRELFWKQKKGESRVDVDAWAAERGPGVREHYKGNPSLGTLSRDSSDSDFFVIL